MYTRHDEFALELARQSAGFVAFFSLIFVLNIDELDF